MSAEADDLDRAANLTQERADAAVADIRHLNRPQQVQNADGTWPIVDCEDCGNEIPEGRLAMGKVRCVYCQERRERRLGL